MKKNSFIIIALILMALLLYWLVRISRRPSESIKESVARTNAVSHTNAAPLVPTKIEPASEERQASALKEKMRYIELNHRKIELYGKAIDQDGNPVTEAQVKGFIIKGGIIGGPDDGGYELQTKTAADGTFHLHGGKGESMSVGVEKAGYEQVMTASYNYTGFKKDAITRVSPDAPVIIKMWKLKGAEPLYLWEKSFYSIPIDGTPVEVDLEAGKIVSSGGDIRIRLNGYRMLAETPEEYQKRRPWSASIEVIEGGLIVKNESKEKINLAPENGYDSSYVYEANDPSSKNWGSQHEQNFFFTSRNGKNYGKLKVYFFPSYKTNNWGAVDISVLMNPNFSRNLEYDPKLRINQK